MRWIWIGGFTVGALSHIWDILHAGTRAYDGYAEPIRFFWFSLALIDPFVVFLLWDKRRSGVVLAVLTIMIDYAVNVSVSLPLSVGSVPAGLTRLTLFAAVVLGTAPMLWRWYSSCSNGR